MLQRLYDQTMALAAHRHALAALALVAFAESSVFPIPPDVMIVPMVLAARDRAWRIAGVCTAASVLGGLAGYGIGYFFFEAVGRPLIAFYGQGETFAAFRVAYNDWGAWIVVGAGLSPFPYKVITIASGVAGLDPVVFTVASTLSRGARFVLVAALLWRFGPPVKSFVEGNLARLVTVFFILLLGGFVAVTYAF